MLSVDDLFKGRHFDRAQYVTTNRQTAAFDAATCELRWRHVLDFKRKPFAAINRGLGYADGRVFRGTSDGRVLAFDAATGRLLWDVQATDPDKEEVTNAAPIVWQGKVIEGIAFSDFHLIGRLMAFDAETGKELWRFATTMGYAAGGGFWTTYSLDPATGEIFGGVANPWPDFNRDVAPGDTANTVYTNSIISLDAATGRLNWHYQAVPRDEHDWDLAAAPTLYRTPAGKDMAAVTGKSGRVYGIDRATKALVFNTPGTTIENDSVALSDKWMRVCPGLQGGAMFNGVAYHPGFDALYVGMNDHCTWYIKDKALGPDGGVPIKDWSAAAKLEAPRGWITAFDGASGALLWQFHTDSQVLAGLVPTKSGLLFGGDTHGGLLALNARNGALLTRIDAGGALNNGLISYVVDGEQYVAAAVGGMTENPSPVAGALRVAIYGLHASDRPRVVTMDRLSPSAAPGWTENHMAFIQACGQCHGLTAGGGSAPALARQSQLSDPERLKQFLITVLPPMPHIYPGVLDDNDVKMIADYLKTDVFKCGPGEIQSCAAPQQPKTGGTEEWRAIYSVVTSPRCINCHSVISKLPLPHGLFAQDQQDYPRQSDDRHPHLYGVLRGDTASSETAEKTGMVEVGIGPPNLRCTSCHGAANDSRTGIPGTVDPARPGDPFWSMAPASMAWESEPGVTLAGPELCARLKDKTRNGNRELADTLHHIATEPLVLWAWNPGTRLDGEQRATPPLDHDAFLAAFSKWMDAGAPCPTE
jgi:alcohol dehydrogenase (cytochrome c)